MWIDWKSCLCICSRSHWQWCFVGYHILTKCKNRKIKWDKIMKWGIEQIVRTCALQNKQLMSILLYPPTRGFHHIPLPSYQGLWPISRENIIGVIFWDTRKYLQRVATYICQTTLGNLGPIPMEEAAVNHLTPSEIAELPKEIQDYISHHRTYLG